MAILRATLHHFEIFLESEIVMQPTVCAPISPPPTIPLPRTLWRFSTPTNIFSTAPKLYMRWSERNVLSQNTRIGGRAQGLPWQATSGRWGDVGTYCGGPVIVAAVWGNHFQYDPEVPASYSCPKTHTKSDVIKQRQQLLPSHSICLFLSTDQLSVSKQHLSFSGVFSTISNHLANLGGIHLKWWEVDAR